MTAAVPVRRGLAGRLLTAQVVVMVAGALTAWAVATVVGPPLFRDHLIRAGHLEGTTEQAHVEEAYRSASAISIAMGLLIALLAGLAVSLYLTARIRRSLVALAGAATEVTRGRFEVTVPPPGLGSEFDTLAAAFNQMAGRLTRVEETRHQMLSDLAHELRTPIATLEGYLEGLEDGVVTWDDEAARVLGEQTDRLARLAEDLGDLSRAEEGRLSLRPASEDAAGLARGAAAAVAEAYARKGVALDVAADRARGCRLEVDRERIGQVLTNLLTNALRHTPVSGQVRLGVTGVGDWVTFTVTDDGDGIPADQIEYVFDRFYRGDVARSPGRGGSGIGLTIARALVTAHGGRIEAASPGPGRGATFTVTLPQARR